MKKHLKLLISSTMIALAFASPQVIHGMNDLSNTEESKKLLGVQLSRGADDTLETVLGSGNGILLKVSMSLDTLKQPLEKEQLEVPARLFLTDFSSSPTNHPTIDLKVKVDCKLTPIICILPDKPNSFDSYAQFTNWLSKGYFSYQTHITYNFHIDINKSAPSLAQHLFSVLPGGYQFIGTHAINNVVIKPNQCVPQVTYSSKRGKTNTTIATLGGTLYLNDFQYPVENFYQSYPHPMIEKIIVERNDTKKFYSHKWLKSDVIEKITYKEFPSNQVQNWPNSPCGTYSLLGQKPDYLENIEHLACWDGNSGEEVDISDGRIFLIVSEGINTPLKDGSQFLESIVKDDVENLYTTRYHYNFPFSLVMRVPEEIKFNILKHTAVNNYFLYGNTSSLGLVCKEWWRIMEQPEMKQSVASMKHEMIYQRFLNGVLVYKPNKDNDDGKIILPISKLANPLEGTFDLSQCGNAGKYLSISTGYHKVKKVKNAEKVEIWLTLRFLVEKELQGTASHFKEILPAKWQDNAPVGIIWTRGTWDDIGRYEYLTSQPMDEIGNNNLYEKWLLSSRSTVPRYDTGISIFTFIL